MLGPETFLNTKEDIILRWNETWRRGGVFEATGTSQSLALHGKDTVTNNWILTHLLPSSERCS